MPRMGRDMDSLWTILMWTSKSRFVWFSLYLIFIYKLSFDTHNTISSCYSWHSTWQLAVTLAEAMNRKMSRVLDGEVDETSPEVERKNSTLAKWVTAPPHQIPLSHSSPQSEYSVQSDGRMYVYYIVLHYPHYYILHITLAYHTTCNDEKHYSS